MATQNTEIIRKGQLEVVINLFNDKLEKIVNAIRENRECIEDAIRDTQELHVDSIKLLLGIIKDQNLEILEGKEALSQDKINKLKEDHEHEMESLKNIINTKDQQIRERDKKINDIINTKDNQIRERDKKINDLESKINNVNKLLNNGFENYFRSIIKKNGQTIVEYDLRLHSVEDLIKCGKENVFNLDNSKLIGTNVAFYNSHRFKSLELHAQNVKFNTAYISAINYINPNPNQNLPLNPFAHQECQPM